MSDMHTKHVDGHTKEHHDHIHGHEEHHVHKTTFITKYIFSQDHKMISKQFLITGMIMGFVGMMLSMFFRMQLGFPQQPNPILETFLGKWAPGGVMDPNFYLTAVTIHGTIIVFMVLTAGLSGTFSNLLIPLQCGARDMAAPFLNMLSYWFFFISSALMLGSLFVETGGASGGWVVYPPLSALPKAALGSGLGMTLWLFSIIAFVVSVLLGGLNYITTVVNLRTKGMSMTRLPLSIWAFLITAILALMSFPVLLSAGLMLTFDRSLGTSFFLSDIFISGEAMEQTGGSPILFQHLFWFLGHPEVYIILLPSLGITSEVLAVNSRKPIFGYRAMVASMLAIAFLSFIVWGHHMYITGMNPFLGSVFVFTTLLIAIPSAIKAFNYITTLWRGNIRFTPGMLFAIGVVSLFITGGVTGLVLADSALDVNLHNTYFVVAHFHIVMGMASMFGTFAGVYHWFPRMFGRMMNNKLGYVHFWLTLTAAYGVFFPMHYIGLAGVPRRYYNYTSFEIFHGFADINTIISCFAFLGGFAQLIFFFNFIYSSIRGPRSPKNPWGATTLEWTAPVEHLHGNWPGEIPTVHRWAYDYSLPGIEEEFVPQDQPLSEAELKEVGKHH